MEPNPYDSPSQTNETSRRSYRFVITALACIALIALGYFWISSITGRKWINAAVTFTALVATAPWMFHHSHIRDAASASISIFVGALGAILATILYFQMFNFDWFRNAFNDKGTGPFGLLIFFGMGFIIGWLITCRFLFIISFPTENFLKSRKKNTPQNAG